MLYSVTCASPVDIFFVTWGMRGSSRKLSMCMYLDTFLIRIRPNVLGDTACSFDNRPTKPRTFSDNTQACIWTLLLFHGHKFGHNVLLTFVFVKRRSGKGDWAYLSNIYST